MQSLVFLITVSPGRYHFLSLQLRTLQLRYVPPFAPQGHIGFPPQTQNCLIPKSGGLPTTTQLCPSAHTPASLGSRKGLSISLKSSASGLLPMVRNFSLGPPSQGQVSGDFWIQSPCVAIKQLHQAALPRTFLSLQGPGWGTGLCSMMECH